MKKKRKNTVLYVLLALLIPAVAVMVYFAAKNPPSTPVYEPEISQAGLAVHVPSSTPKPRETPSSDLTEPINILLIGVDNNSGSSQGARGNSDGVMFATINPDTREIVLTSFMRDTRVRVQDSYYDKVTNIYHTGDVALLRETLEQNFEVPIDYYAVFGYLDVAAIVDAVGGVDVELSMQEIADMEGKIIDISYMRGADYKDNVLSVDQAGPITLNGIQAAAYTRIRPADGGYDLGRTERGRNVVMGVLNKAFQMNSSDLLQLAGVIYDQITTDIPDSLFLQLGMNSSELRNYQMISDHIPVDGSYESGNTGSGYYVIPDFEINNKHLQESLFKGIHN